ncbi:hypothetical protein FRX31_024275 [Thalictrum thalictroides]|uniref:Uncharacterized protein n=1 Tax=Thalictrum thalictroides TaxID=46969 RepID=A0A7J6VN01_THATH|nr:hypothetical protein FRX31_024275 [Thalictrum thalictroides]
MIFVMGEPVFFSVHKLWLWGMHNQLYRVKYSGASSAANSCSDWGISYSYNLTWTRFLAAFGPVREPEVLLKF